MNRWYRPTINKPCALPPCQRNLFGAGSTHSRRLLLLCSLVVSQGLACHFGKTAAIRCSSSLKSQDSPADTNDVSEKPLVGTLRQVSSTRIPAHVWCSVHNVDACEDATRLSQGRLRLSLKDLMRNSCGLGGFTGQRACTELRALHDEANVGRVMGILAENGDPDPAKWVVVPLVSLHKQSWKGYPETKTHEYLLLVLIALLSFGMQIRGDFLSKCQLEHRSGSFLMNKWLEGLCYFALLLGHTRRSRDARSFT